MAPTNFRLALASLSDELPENLAGVWVDCDAMGFVHYDDEATVISSERCKHGRQDDRERRREVGRVRQSKIPQTNRDWAFPDAKGRGTVEYLRTITLCEPAQTGGDDPAAIPLATRQGPGGRRCLDESNEIVNQWLGAGLLPAPLAAKNAAISP